MLCEHVTSAHGISGSPEDLYVRLLLGGQYPACKCGCGNRPPWHSWRTGYKLFILGHSGRIYATRTQEEAEAISEQRAAKLRGRVGWSKGLTKETSQSLARGAVKRSKTVSEQFSSGGREQWCKGRTKDDCAALEVLSQKLIAGHASGRLSAWHKGRTKEDCDGLTKMSASIRKTFKEKGLAQAKRKSPEDITTALSALRNLEMVSDVSQYEHYQRKNLIFRCKLCGALQERSFVSALTDRCYSCCPYSSKGQLEIASLVRSEGFPVIINDRTALSKFELDVYVPSGALAIEFNGLYWHSDRYKDADYHVRKTKACLRAGIRLIHVFEDEWRDKRSIVEGMIRHRLKRTSQRIMARKCVLGPVSSSERREFFEAAHIDGDARATQCLGLWLGERLVAALSLRTPRQEKYRGLIEVSRFATAPGTAVVGGLGKLVSAAKVTAAQAGASGLMTYVDIRHGDGKSYQAVGFEMVGVTAPRFWWSNDMSRFDRFKFRADPVRGMSEVEVAAEAGVHRIYGCPNLVMRLDLPTPQLSGLSPAQGSAPPSLRP